MNTESNEGVIRLWVEWGGVWRFRQIRDTFNNICFEINPSFVNVPTALRVGNVDINDIYIYIYIKRDRGLQVVSTARMVL